VSRKWLESEARAKLNLVLRIFPRGTDGYHPLETAFCRIELADTVRLRLRDEPGVSITVSGVAGAPEGPENLAAKAASLFIERAGIAAGVQIELKKSVPSGSGLGGGSSDAAAVLRLLAGAIDRPPDRTALLEMARELGADVSFFVADAPVALATGRGERLVTVEPLEARPMLLVLTPIEIPTADAYAQWDSACEHGYIEMAAPAPELSPDSLKSWDDVRALARNDFEPVILSVHPALAAIKDRLQGTRPFLALLSGSGSALFAIYEDEARRDEAASILGSELEGVQVISVCGPV
jgi:4-diphosphocytidyl-2-C-methyl-D-erythritol kinase